MDPLARKIQIWIKGNDNNYLFNNITRELEIIHKALNNPTYQQMVGCTCAVCKNSQNPAFYDYGQLTDFLKNKIKKVPCPHSYQEVMIDSLVSWVQTAEGTDNYVERQSKLSRNQPIFIFANLLDNNTLNYIQNTTKLTPDEIMAILSIIPPKTILNIKTKIEKGKGKNQNSIIALLNEVVEKNIIPIGYSISGTMLFEIFKALFK
jgi:hypothetical protein